MEMLAKKDPGHSGHGYGRCRRRSEAGLGPELQPEHRRKMTPEAQEGEGLPFWGALKAASVLRRTLVLVSTVTAKTCRPRIGWVDGGLRQFYIGLRHF